MHRGLSEGFHCMRAAINSSFLSWSSSPSWVSCPSLPAWRRVAARPFSRHRNQHCLFAFGSDRTCSSCTFRTDGHSATGSIPHDTTRHTHGTRSTISVPPHLLLFGLFLVSVDGRPFQCVLLLDLRFLGAVVQFLEPNEVLRCRPTTDEDATQRYLNARVELAEGHAPASHAGDNLLVGHHGPAHNIDVNKGEWVKQKGRDDCTWEG